MKKITSSGQVASFIFEGGEESEAVAAGVAALARATGRNLLALFTAHERLRRARERLVERLPRGTLLLAQEWDGPPGLLADRFRTERGAVLLGVQSLWEGVDFPGAALEILVVAKLPFSVPDDPLVEARGERLRERGLDPFRDDALPEAVLRFRQGIGRLIRRDDDRGVLVVCDPRLERASGQLKNEQTRQRTMTVKGIYDVGVPSVEKSMIYMSLGEAQELFGLDGQVTEVVVSLKEIGQERGVVNALNGAVSGYEIETWDSSFPELKQTMDMKTGCDECHGHIHAVYRGDRHSQLFDDGGLRADA